MTIPCQEATVSYDEKKRNTILDYLVDVKKLAQSDRILNYAGANYSVTGPLYIQYVHTTQRLSRDLRGKGKLPCYLLR
jgi:hypothetical protein